MILVVNDACVLVDLIDVDLFDEFLQLGFNSYITTLVLNELDSEYEPPVADASVKNHGGRQPVRQRSGRPYRNEAGAAREPFNSRCQLFVSGQKDRCHGSNL